LGRLGQARLLGCDARDAGPQLAGQQLGRCGLLRGLDRGLLLLMGLEGKTKGVEGKTSLNNLKRAQALEFKP
jgi:hypothetical protein